LRIINPRKLNSTAQYIICIGLVLLVAIACYFFSDFIAYKTVALLLLMAVSVAAMLFDILPVLCAAAVSAMLWNYFFIPPVFTFHIDNAEDFLMFLLYFIVASVSAVLNFKIRKEEKKVRDKEEKEKSIRLYNTLLNSLSHELRTPIATIIGSVDALKEGKGKYSLNQQNVLLNEIDKASMRLNRQVDNLLNMSRLETGILKPNKDWCDVNELIHFVINKIEDNKNHIIKVIEKENVPLFKIDRGLIEQVLLNLIHNAINYTPENTIITIVAIQESAYCKITVSDNGPGINASEKKLVFDKFYRIPQTKAGGSGLGLSIVKGFVEAHGGTVRLEKSAEGGASFVCLIPSEFSYINNLTHE
jgi:two-component system sensor histidine kinase KdpD